MPGRDLFASPAFFQRECARPSEAHLAAFAVGLILVTGGLGISWNSLQSIGDKHAPPSSGAIAALLVAIVIRTVMSGLKFQVGRRISSAALVADAWNDAVDILAAGAALTAVGLALYDGDRFLAEDHYGGFAVGLIVVRPAFACCETRRLNSLTPCRTPR